MDGRTSPAVQPVGSSEESQCVCKDRGEGIEDDGHQPEGCEALADFETFVPAGDEIRASWIVSGDAIAWTSIPGKNPASIVPVH